MNEINGYFRKQHNKFFLAFALTSILVISACLFIQINTISSLFILSIVYLGLITFFHYSGLKIGWTIIGFDWFDAFNHQTAENIKYQGYISALQKKVLLPVVSPVELAEAVLKIEMERKLKIMKKKIDNGI